MNHHSLVRILHGFAHFVEQVQAFFDRELVLVTILIDGAAFHIVHHQEGQSFGRATAVKQLDDVGMVQPSQGLTFIAETVQEVTAVQSRLYELDRHLLAVFVIGARLPERRHPCHLVRMRLTSL